MIRTGSGNLPTIYDLTRAICQIVFCLYIIINNTIYYYSYYIALAYVDIYYIYDVLSHSAVVIIIITIISRAAGSPIIIHTFHTARRVILLFVYLSEIRKRDKTLWKTPVRTAVVSCALRGSRDVRALLPHGTPGLLGHRDLALETRTRRVYNRRRTYIYTRLAVAEDNFRLAAAAAHVSPRRLPSRSRQRSRPVRAML